VPRLVGCSDFEGLVGWLGVGCSLSANRIRPKMGVRFFGSARTGCLRVRARGNTTSSYNLLVGQTSLGNQTTGCSTYLTSGWLVAYIIGPTVGWLPRQPTPTWLLIWLVVDHPGYLEADLGAGDKSCLGGQKQPSRNRISSK
jgi:hypothetical protein